MKNESKKIKIKGIPFGVLLAGKVWDGSKTVTRRVVKDDVTFGNWDETIKHCPYAVGQLLYVREPWRVDVQYDTEPSGSKHIPDVADVEYLSERLTGYSLGSKLHCFPDLVGGRSRIARFMPARFARTFLRVMGVRCERLGEITEVDAINEGVERIVWSRNMENGAWIDYQYKGSDFKHGLKTSIESFFSLWDSINGKDSHLQNPWVWVISFERVEMPNPWSEESPWTPSWTKCDGEWLYGNRDHILGCDYAINVAFDGFMLWDWSVSICGKVTDEGHAVSADEAKINAVKAYRKSSKGIVPHLL